MSGSIINWKLVSVVVYCQVETGHRTASTLVLKTTSNIALSGENRLRMACSEVQGHMKNGFDYRRYVLDMS